MISVKKTIKKRKEFDVSDIENQNEKTIRRKEIQKRKEEKRKEVTELQVPNRIQNIQNLLRSHKQTPILSSRHIRNRRRPTPHPFLPLNTQRIALAFRTFIMITTIVIIIIIMVVVVVVMAPLAREARR